MSTPVGIHDPVSPESFSKRVDVWHARTMGTEFLHSDFADAMAQAKDGDLVYCDPPYGDSQSILYGAQAFSIQRLFGVIAGCKQRGAKVVHSALTAQSSLAENFAMYLSHLACSREKSLSAWGGQC